MHSLSSLSHATPPEEAAARRRPQHADQIYAAHSGKGKLPRTRAMKKPIFSSTHVLTVVGYPGSPFSVIHSVATSLSVTAAKGGSLFFVRWSMAM